jgi:polyisoprenoid-binding protein YceI
LYEEADAVAARRLAFQRVASFSKELNVMKLRILAAVSLVGLSAAVLGFAPHAGNKEAVRPTASDVGPEWKIDPVHSSMVFRIKHMSTAWFYGRFNDISGTVGFDPAKPEASSFNVEIKTASVDTNSKNRDNHLKSGDFFNADQFPTCTFASTGLTAGANDTFDLKGDLTLNGQTKAISAKLEKTGEGKSRDGSSVVGFEATFTINRQDFGIKYGPGALGDDVRVTISLEATKK